MGINLILLFLMAKVKINWFEVVRAVLAALMGALGGGAVNIM